MRVDATVEDTELATESDISSSAAIDQLRTIEPKPTTAHGERRGGFRGTAMPVNIGSVPDLVAS
jgi:hypothetical protein